jgi:hypothetical protein
MFTKIPKNKTFFGVAMLLILSGAILLAFGLVAWLINVCANANVNSWPFAKVMGGLVIIGLGYCVLILELIRLK